MFALQISRPLYISKPGRRLLSVLVPPKSKGWPTPWITESDATNYLFPLYSQGWYVAAVSSDRPAVKTAGLACRFTFPSCPPAAAFIKDVLTLTETEKHHPCWLKLTNSGDNSSVHICSTTHSALRPEWDPTDTPESRALQGITLRDLRFAALISSLPSNTFLPSTEIGPSRTRPTWDEFCATLRFWSTPSIQNEKPADSVQEVPDGSTDGVRQRQQKRPLVCAACAGPHPTSACPTRDSIPPPPCSICRGLHWRVDCPVGKQAQRTNKTVSQIKKTLLNPQPSEPPSESMPKLRRHPLEGELPRSTGSATVTGRPKASCAEG
ncbi:hypothetical protein MVEN_02474500 [Mycena venus]|uniref:4a-hydroxytetrahydrobiopterin dehydratase n=1 Tax=Mycena venus TaxID=2733690 RepID=A0A8H6WXA6_9AGAR|nr:hypothetical protein MVEN_02474500 [Mycena venus]